MYLLDTNVVLALVRGSALGTYIDTSFRLSAGKRRPAISVVTHGELRVLASRNGWGGAKLAALQNALNALVTVDINVAEVIDAYVEIDVYSQQHPDGARNMGKNDLWIAACEGFGRHAPDDRQGLRSPHPRHDFRRVRRSCLHAA
ncbi:MAG: hypothetical protein IPL19_32470 [Sandaracinaceae bacterium]|nr:hypothetical protein [Sandaracinaceae bacterium]